ncbi:O-acyltransferase like protein-like [Lingula anatina]|uniref:O-acyltransferase like protein-like n=1 Tax=Lingula anatina TaxID=7574 RepID=A0A1S3IRL9_LINAN|nr:O-acyltransferase like protein-like [Lingula anatina]|eukprot:XP_013400860.1 O-acyltransferase like protein-like [Lingula anatina]
MKTASWALVASLLLFSQFLGLAETGGFGNSDLSQLARLTQNLLITLWSNGTATALDRFIDNNFPAIVEFLNTTGLPLMRTASEMVINTLQYVKAYELPKNATVMKENLKGVFNLVNFDDFVGILIQGAQSGLLGRPANVSSECYEDAFLFLQGLQRGEPWALKLLDAMGKPETGIYQGNLMWMGFYDECVGTTARTTISVTPGLSVDHEFQGKYCLVKIPFPDGVLNAPQGASIQVAMCVSERCSSRDLTAAFRSIGARDAVQIVCKGDRRLDFRTDAGAICASILGCVFVLVVILGTVYDVLDSRYFSTSTKTSRASKTNPSKKNNVTLTRSMCDECKKTNSCQWCDVCCASMCHHNKVELDGGDEIQHRDNDGSVTSFGLETYKNGRRTDEDQLLPKKRGKCLLILRAFSLYSNVQKIMDTDSPAGTLHCVNAIRVLSITWVILGHTYFTMTAFGVMFSNPLQVFQKANEVTFMAIFNGTFPVDVFFLMSGLFVSYVFLGRAQRLKKVTFKEMSFFYIHRFWRITPLYAMVIFLNTTITPYVMHGPMAPEYSNDEKYCRMNWWQNLLYVNNLVNPAEMNFIEQNTEQYTRNGQN